ncbi:hypothetical protein DIPPA_11663 [Diplonema papillatum]|nr:hypothetical protein DIPPA_11663 [Diplonema papillatum]
MLCGICVYRDSTTTTRAYIRNVLQGNEEVQEAVEWLQGKGLWEMAKTPFLLHMVMEARASPELQAILRATDAEHIC